MSDRKPRRTACVQLGRLRIPIVGRISAGGRVDLFDTPAARRLVGPAREEGNAG